MGVSETGTLRHHGSCSSHPPSFVRWSEIGYRLVSVHVVSGGRRVRGVVAPGRGGETLVTWGHGRIPAGACSGHRVLVFRSGPPGDCRCWWPEGQGGSFPVISSPRRVGQIVIGGCVRVLMVIQPNAGIERSRSSMMTFRWGVIPGLTVMGVSDNAGLWTFPVLRKRSFGGDVKRSPRAVVGGDAGGRRVGRAGRGGGRRSRGRARHAAVADGSGGGLGDGGRGALLVEAAVHHRPPGHPGGRPRSGGWGWSGRMYMVVEGGCRARHGVRDGEDDGGCEQGSQHRRSQTMRGDGGCNAIARRAAKAGGCDVQMIWFGRSRRCKRQNSLD